MNGEGDDWFGVMIELRRILYTSMERMDSCRVISILKYVFLPMTDTTTSVFHDSSSISKNERDKRGVHLPILTPSQLTVLSKPTQPSYPQFLIPPQSPFPVQTNCSFTLSESQYLKPIAESQIRDMVIPSDPHTLTQGDTDRKSENHHTTLQFIDMSPEDCVPIGDNTSYPYFNNKSYHFSRYNKSSTAIWFDKKSEMIVKCLEECERVDRVR